MIVELEQKIRSFNTAYRAGNPLVTDQEYDSLIEQLKGLDPENELLLETGSLESVDKNRMTKLPILMHSFQKAYEEDLIKFLNKNKSNYNNIILLSGGFGFSPHQAVSKIKFREKTNLLGVFHDPYP